MTVLDPAATGAVAAGPHAPGLGTVAVSMPYWRTPGTVRAAVDAVLAQTYDDLLLYVVNDGDHTSPPWAELADVEDPRLIRVDLPDNRGRYFADAVVLAATSAPWFAIHDADDLAEPDWLATLLGACHHNEWVAAFAPQDVVRLDGTTYREPVGDLTPTPGRLKHLAHHAGVYVTDALRAVGGPHPGYRVGFDTLLPVLMAMHGPVGAVDRVLYRRILRPGSLTTAPATRRGSSVRRRARLNLDLLLSRCWAGGPTAAAADHGPALTALVASTAEAVRAGDLSPAAARRDQRATVLDEHVWGGWALDRHAAEEVAAHLAATQPRTVLESGSGMSTILLAEYAARTGARVVSLEHNPRYARATGDQLKTRGLAGAVDLLLAELGQISTPLGPRPWYQAELPDDIEFALIDGPPGSIGRAGAMWALYPHLSGDHRWQVWLDDALLTLPGRESEADAIAEWTTHLDLRAEVVPFPKGCARITSRYAGRPRPVHDASDVAVTILTGGRPDLLAATVDSVREFAPGLLESAHVAVLVNGCPFTADTVRQWDFADHVAELGERMPIGPAVSALHAHPAPRPYVLHLEDDWAVATMDPAWLDQARAALDADPSIGQVRLRHRGDEVRTMHMVTRRPIVWRPGPAGTVVADAHYTLNPTLMRTQDLPRLWPATGELAAARTFSALGWKVAQSVPGAFRHIGDGASLRLGQR